MKKKKDKVSFCTFEQCIDNFFRDEIKVLETTLHKSFAEIRQQISNLWDKRIHLDGRNLRRRSRKILRWLRFDNVASQKLEIDFEGEPISISVTIKLVFNTF